MHSIHSICMTYSGPSGERIKHREEEQQKNTNATRLISSGLFTNMV